MMDNNVRVGDRVSVDESLTMLCVWTVRLRGGELTLGFRAVGRNRREPGSWIDIKSHSVRFAHNPRSHTIPRHGITYVLYTIPDRDIGDLSVLHDGTGTCP